MNGFDLDLSANGGAATIARRRRRPSPTATATPSTLDRRPRDGSALGSPEDLDEVIAAIRDRRRELRDRERNRNRRALTPGTAVRFVERIRPTYMIGLTATVVKVDRTRVLLDCPTDDPRYRRFKGRIRCPLDLVEAVEGGEA